MTDLLIGADPEFFLARNGQPISAHDIVPGNKKRPYPLQRGAVQADGTACEFNIVPAISPEDFANNIQATLRDIRSMLSPDLTFEFKPSVIYPEAYFDALPNFSKELGCDPDYNAYTGNVNPRPTPPEAYKSMRTGAGHIHLGWTAGKDPLSRSHFWDCREVTKALDNWFFNIQSLWDKDPDRRKLYGARGAFRPKRYGCEYRVLSNAWLKYPRLWPWIFKSVQYLFKHLCEGEAFLVRFNPLYISTKEINENILHRTNDLGLLIPEDWNKIQNTL